MSHFYALVTIIKYLLLSHPKKRTAPLYEKIELKEHLGKEAKSLTKKGWSPAKDKSYGEMTESGTYYALNRWFLIEPIYCSLATETELHPCFQVLMQMNLAILAEAWLSFQGQR